MLHLLVTVQFQANHPNCKPEKTQSGHMFEEFEEMAQKQTVTSEMLSYSTQHKVAFERTMPGANSNLPTEVKQTNLYSFHWPNYVSNMLT